MEVVTKQGDQVEGPPADPAKHGGAPSPGNRLFRSILLLLVVAVAALVVIWGISSRRQANVQLAAETQELAVPTVSVVHPKPGAPQQEVVLPGDMQPYIDAPIFARTNGYLKKWYADIGARVKSGELLAEIDAPEIDQQLLQARADLATAEANLRLADITATRYKELLKTDSVSQQDVDNATGNLDARRTTAESARSNVKRLEQLQSFEKVYAPFDGMITGRNTDIGQLIDSGSSGGTARELFHIASVSRLRVYVNVPQIDAPQISTGLRAQLVLTEFPGRTFEGIVVRSSGSIDASTRTLLTEVDVDNSSGLLKPGSYVEVHLRLPTPVNAFTLPVNATIFKSAGMQVAVVKNGKTVSLIPITIGRDFGTEIEVVSGLKGDEAIVLNPPDSLANGSVVRLAENGAPSQRKP